MTKEWKPPRPTTAIVSSYEGAITACASVPELAFPLIAVPWGAERYGTPCRLFLALEELNEEDIDLLLRSAFPHGGARQLHLISVKTHVIGGVWGTTIPGPWFTLST